jgi:predicted nicotinamide N-methyase
MMELPLELNTYSFNSEIVQLYVPDAQFVFERYQKEKQADQDIPFPYWTRVWPAARSICQFLASHNELIRDKHVLELAAGLGLPSLFASRLAKTVQCSDYIPEAMKVVQKSIGYNQINNIDTSILDWHYLPEKISAEILLLSDINYDPDEFESLLATIEVFLNRGSNIILSTPQRLMAKPFIEQLLPWIVEQEEIIVRDEEQAVTTNIFLLQSVKFRKTF